MKYDQKRRGSRDRDKSKYSDSADSEIEETDMISTPVINVLCKSNTLDGYAEFMEQYLELCKKIHFHRKYKSLVDFHKWKLGKQDRCQNLEYRQWIWETENWRVYVSNTQGISFEVKENSTPDEALRYFDEYSEKILKP